METIQNKIMRFSLFSFSAFLTFSLLSFTTINSAPSTSANYIAMKQTKIVITKMTTLEELEEIKAQMISEGLGFDYSNIIYNEKNEIISISIKYKDANNNSGNYSVSSKNPINDIVIIADGKQISIKAVGNGNQSYIQQGNSAHTAADMEKAQAERRAQMQERSQEMKKRMEEHKKAMEERRTKMEKNMTERRDSMLNQSTSINSQKFGGELRTVTNTATDVDLKKLEQAYDKENITFSYTNLKRNASGLITYISITVNNRNGSVSTSSFGNGVDPIKNISLSVDQKHTIMKNE